MELAYILIECNHGKIKIVSTALNRFEEVDEIHEVFGRFDIVIKVLCEDKTELKSFIQNKLQITEGIRATETLMVNDLLSE